VSQADCSMHVAQHNTSVVRLMKTSVNDRMMLNCVTDLYNIVVVVRCVVAETVTDQLLRQEVTDKSAR